MYYFRLFVDAKKLKSVCVSHNHLVSLPGEVDFLPLEELYIQHNLLSRLPNNLLARANKSVPNVSTTQLDSRP